VDGEDGEDGDEESDAGDSTLTMKACLVSFVHLVDFHEYCQDFDSNFKFKTYFLV
jgi:hypothetical protein